MKGNDLSSAPVPRIALVFEGALAWPPGDKPDAKEFTRLMQRGQWEAASKLMEFNERMETVIWDRSWRCSMTIDLITYAGPDRWAEAVAHRVAEHELPVHSIWATTPNLLARKLPFMYDLVRIYDPYPQHQLKFGGKGVYLTDPNQLGY